MIPKRRRIAVLLLGTTIVIASACVYYVRSHPLVFNESLFGHAHCIAQTGLALHQYADENAGRFPSDTNGYGNALLHITNEVGHFWGCLTGPGYDGQIFALAARTGGRIPESRCGRVYVQGLSESNDPEIAILFDKLPTPGGDHCHFPRRLVAPLAREVSLIDGSYRVIRETNWLSFSQRQIELLVKAGMPREEAKGYYNATPKE